jgi:hypothetical protein
MSNGENNSSNHSSSNPRGSNSSLRGSRGPNAPNNNNSTDRGVRTGPGDRSSGGIGGGGSGGGERGGRGRGRGRGGLGDSSQNSFKTIDEEGNSGSLPVGRGVGKPPYGGKPGPYSSSRSSHQNWSSEDGPVSNPTGATKGKEYSRAMAEDNWRNKAAANNLSDGEPEGYSQQRKSDEFGRLDDGYVSLPSANESNGGKKATESSNTGRRFHFILEQWKKK